MSSSQHLIGLGIFLAKGRQLPRSRQKIVANLAAGFGLGLLAATLGFAPAFAAGDVAPAVVPGRSLFPPDAASGTRAASAPRPAPRPRRADFARENASGEARHIAHWVVDSGDSRGLPFAIVDKTDAKVFVFDAGGRLRGAAPVLLGMALGDEAVPGIGDRPLSRIRPEERTTPAGRFVASLDRNLRGKEILWVDYDSAVSMHPVISAKPEERRRQRLATPTPLDNRISYGCINVPVKFFANVVHPAFAGTDGIVYVLPESRLAREIFASYDVVEAAE